MPPWGWILIGLGVGSILLGVSSSNSTPANMSQIRAALVSAWTSLTGSAPDDDTLALLAAQIALETANGSALMGNNVGNFKARQGDPGAITFATTEYVGGKLIHLPAGAPGAWFRSWPTLAAGTVAYLSALKGQFGASWQSVLDGDTLAFATALKNHGYFTAPLFNETDSTGKFVPGYVPGLLSRGAPPVETADNSPPNNATSATFENNDDDEPTAA
jgi:hypothetical protein